MINNLAALNGQKPLFVFMTGDLAERQDGETLPEGVRTLRKPFRISDLVAVLSESLAGAAEGSDPFVRP